MQILPVLEDYELRFSAINETGIVGSVFQFTRFPSGATYYVEVGTVSAWHDLGPNDTFRPHWKVRVFLEDTKEYDAASKVTIEPRFRERAGFSVVKGHLPPYHSDLPEAIIRSMLVARLCTEPLWAQIYHSNIATVLSGYGEITYDDD